ncbi:hypothetical protein Lal_00019792 [Lupinus albus]|nr:hypothetical protein Lal_00019792 [Lupinus albus]
MAPLDVCPTEDAVQAFLEHLVDQLLPEKSSIRDKPTTSQQQLVAKQVRSVVLLYNYYHRKQHPELAYLPFNEFCKLVVVMRPPLLSYMSFMQEINETDLTDGEKQLSLTEKMIIDSCDICKCLDASKKVPNIEGWPISKVAVLLINSTKECCFLLFGSITNGVWGVVEKALDTSSRSSEVTPRTENTYIKKRVIRRPTKDELNADDSEFLQVGYSAVKEATGINNTDVTLLESYTVYSHSKEKAASRFYIMQCSQLIHQKVIQVPIKDLIESLRGPLVKKSCGTWMITPVVDYFHVLPYSEIISEWISREAFSSSVQHSWATQKNIMDSPEVTQSYENEDTFIALGSKPSGYNIESLKQKENNGRFTLGLPDHINDRRDIDLDRSSILKSPTKEKCHYIPNTEQPGEDQDKNTPNVQYYSNGSTSAVKMSTSLVLSTNYTCAGRNEAHQSYQPPSPKPLSVNYHQGEKVDTTKLVPVGGSKNVAPYDRSCTKRHNTSSDVEKLQVLLDSKGKLLSEAALSTLMRKRNELALQQREIEDKIVMCDKTIQRMLTDGEDHFELKIESIIEGCNDISAKNQERMVGHQGLLPPFTKRNKLSEAELDSVCHANNWVLPTFQLIKKDGGIHADVTVKGVEFECCCRGNVCFAPREARESAAAQMLTNLRNIAKPDQ